MKNSVVSLMNFSGNSGKSLRNNFRNIFGIFFGSLALLITGCNSSNVPIEIVIEGTLVDDVSMENGWLADFGARPNSLPEGAVICAQIFYFTNQDGANAPQERMFEKCESIKIIDPISVPENLVAEGDEGQGKLNVNEVEKVKLLGNFVNVLTIRLPADFKAVNRVEASAQVFQGHKSAKIHTELLESGPMGIGRYKGVVLIKL